MKRIASLASSEVFYIILSAVLFSFAVLFKILSLEIWLIVFSCLALLAAGNRVFWGAFLGIIRRDFLDEKFLMTISSLGAMIIGEYLEGAAVMLFFIVGEYFEHRAVREARRSVKSLMSICPDEGRVLRSGEEMLLDSEDIEVGDVLILHAGDRVAADAVIISGSSDFDTSSITGESLPRELGVGDNIQSGFVNLTGALRARVVRPAEESSAMRILNLVENASEKKAKEEAFITKFSRIYTPAVVIFALLFAFLPPLFNILSFKDSVYRALTFLVISCPCALVISVPMAFFAGIGSSCKNGILFKGGAYFSPVANADTVLLDKTGTLTSGTLRISSITENGVEKGELMAILASLESGSNHPVARAVLSEYKPVYRVSSQRELAGRGTVGVINGKEAAAGNARLMEELGVKISEGEPTGVGEIFISFGGEYIGRVSFSDTVKSEAAAVISSLRRLGIKRVEILSGDNEAAVREVALEIGADAYHAELLPEDKYRIIEMRSSECKNRLMYVGDGINDAPSLRLAPVGVSFGGIGADSAVDASDLVIMSDNLEKIPKAIKSARKTLAIAKQNIVFAIGVKLAVMLLGALGITNMWLAVFADVGVAVLAILNSLRCLKCRE